MTWLKSKPFAVRVCRLRYTPPCINQIVASVWGQCMNTRFWNVHACFQGKECIIMLFCVSPVRKSSCFRIVQLKDRSSGLKCKSLLLMIAVVWGFFCNKVLIRCSTVVHCSQPDLHHNNVPCVQSYKHLTKCTFNISNKQKKQRNPGVSYCRK